MYVITNPNIQFVFYVYVSSKNKLRRSIFNKICIFNSEALKTKKCRLSHKNLVPNVFFFLCKKYVLIENCSILSILERENTSFFYTGSVRKRPFQLTHPLPE